MTKIIRISRTNEDFFYHAHSVEMANTDMEKSGYLEAVKQNKVICMGHTVFEPMVWLDREGYPSELVSKYDRRLSC